jgi:hypothetical protein
VWKAGARYHSVWLLYVLVHAIQYQWKIHKSNPWTWCWHKYLKLELWIELWFSFFPWSFHFLFWFVQTLAISKGPLTDEVLIIVLVRFCHFMMHEFILPRGVYHVPDGHMTQFLALCHYIEQGWSKQLETHRKFKEICGCL